MFQHTEYLWFLFAVPLLAGLKLWMDARGQRVVREFTAPRLRESLIVGVSPWRSWLAMALYLLALVGFIVALAQPQWGEERLAVPERGRNIFIAIDTSRSMLARDVVPDRLTRAKLAVQDLVEQLPGERIGLLAVAGRSYLQAPLTTDHSAILESLQSFDHTIIEWGGSDLNDLMEVTLRAIKKLPSSNYALVIFSDGGDPDARLTEKIQQITKNKIVVVAVGVGTEAGAIIPDPEQPGDYVRDAQGNVVKTKLETGVLQQLASGTGGRFVKLGTQPLNKEVIQPILDRLKEQDSASRQKTKPIERFAWPLGAGIVLLMIAWLIRPSPPQRRTGFGLPIGASLLLLATVHPAATAAESPGQLAAYSKDSSDVSPAEAKAAFDHKDYRKAQRLYEKLLTQNWDPAVRDDLEYGYAAAAHKMQDYEASVLGFSEALQSEDSATQLRSHRGMAHTLYEQGGRSLAKQPKITLDAWIDSRRHFDAALKIDPGNQELQENRDFVNEMIAKLRQQIQEMEAQKGKKGQKGQKGQKGERGEGEEDFDGEGEGEQEEPQGEKKPEGDDGIGEKEALPEGKIRAAGEDEKEGEGKKKEEKAEGKEAGKEDGNDKPNPRTGYTRKEAESFLRQYMDELTPNITTKQRKPPVNKRDW